MKVTFLWFSCLVLGLGFTPGVFANFPQARETTQTVEVSEIRSAQNKPSEGGLPYEIGEAVSIPGYEAATLMKIEHNGIKVMHHQGVALVLTEHLSPELRSRYELDKEEKIQERLMARGKKLYQARRAQAQRVSQQLRFRITGKVLQVLSDGLLMHSAQILAGKEPKVIHQSSGRHVIGTGPSLRHPDGVPVFEQVEKVVWNEVWRSMNDLIMIKCPTKGVVDEARLEMEVYYLGTIMYKTRDQREKTVYYFGTDVQDAISFAMEFRMAELPAFLKP